MEVGAFNTEKALMGNVRYVTYQAIERAQSFL